MEAISISIGVVNLVLLVFLIRQKTAPPKLKADGSDLIQVLDDMRRHGFAVVRLDPDSLIVRSPRE